MGLIGIIVGFGVAFAMGYGPGGSPAPAAVPTPAAPAAAPSAPTPTPAPAPANPTIENADPVTDRDHVRGNKKATFSLIEYSDFECPFCTRHHPTMQAVIDANNDVNWVYRHFPLSFHPNAQKAAEASECAGEQDKFWEYSDKLFEVGVNTGDFKTPATAVGLDITAFEDCLNSDKHAEYVKDQMSKGSASGVRGTPGTIVLNNKTGKAVLVSGARGADAFAEAIESLK